MSTRRKLTRAERKQIEAAIARAKKQDKKHKSAQDSIPFQRMFPDGICRVSDHYYTKTVQFQDINYQLNQNEDKTAIFDGWCDFLNYFDSSVRFQLSFINMAATKENWIESINIPSRGDQFDDIGKEYEQFLRDQLAKGNNGLIKTKYLTFGIEADNLKSAKPRLERIETDILNNFKRLGVAVMPMNGKDRLELMHGMFHISAVLGATKRNEGYNEGGGYLVSWCYGHLGEFASPDAYEERYKKWRTEDLPIIPKEWEYRVRSDKYEHFKIVKRLMRRDDVETVINACDAGREGERIFRSVYQMAGCKKPIMRLWISSMEDAAIWQGFEHLRPGSDYDNLGAAADCRAKADWLVGINATRLFSVLYHRTLNVGRVVSPTLAMIVQREAEIRTFQPEPFYTVELETEAGKAVSKRIQDKEVAEMLVSACHATEAVVTEVSTQEKIEKAPALYDLTTLQREANRIYGFTAQETLDYVQSLYEKKLVTYPRTDARFLTDDMMARVPEFTAIAAGILGIDVPVAAVNQVCDSSKVTDHHALIPTISARDAEITDLPAGEQKILRLIARQLLCAVSGPYRYTVTVAEIQCGNETFTLKGKTVQDLGWRKYLEEDVRENPLGELVEGQRLTLRNATIKGGQTTPHKRFTEGTLLSAMENAGATEIPKDTEQKGLGTPATRASVIEKLVDGGFICRDQKSKTVNLMPEDVGISLVTVLPEALQSPLMTADWETKLSQVEKGELPPAEFMADVEAFVTDLVKSYKPIRGAEVLFPSGRPVVGTCPRCGGDVTESKLGYFCEANDCRFALWRDNKFLSGKRINLTRKLASELLKHGRAEVAGMYSERTGKTFDAVLVLADNGERVLYQLDFPNRKGA